MTSLDLFELVLLGAIWGASFPLMRVAVPEFGAPALMFVRVLVAAIFLTLITLLRRSPPVESHQRRHLIVLGIINSALPFTLLGVATRSLSAGFTSVLNATAPMWGALVARLWLGERIDSTRVVGLFLGALGVFVLMFEKVAVTGSAFVLAVSSGLIATFFYGLSANYTRRFLTGAPPLLVSRDSMASASLALLPFALTTWPDTSPSGAAWASALFLGVVGTGIAYLLYFRLISHIGPARAISVTFLIPVFGTLWGVVFLSENIGPYMIGGGLMVLLGTALSNGALTLLNRRHVHSSTPR